MESSRSLWDQEYLDSGCTLDYDEETNVDDLAWTCASNFVVMAIGVAAFVKLVHFPCVGREKSVIWLPLYFLLTGIGFGVAAIGHILVKTKSDLKKYPIETVSYLFAIGSNILLVLLGFAMCGVTLSSGVRWKTVLWWIVVVPISALLIYASFTSITLGGGVMTLTSLFLIIVYSVRVFKDGEGKFLNITKALAVGLHLGSMLIQLFLRGRCGGPAYKNCFEECPLPEGFNHNALYHFVDAVAFIIWAMAEDITPSVVQGDGGNCCCVGSDTVNKDDEDETRKEDVEAGKN